MASFVFGGYSNDDTSIIITVVSFLAALVLSIIFLPKSSRERMGNGGRFFHDLFNFRHFFIGDILKFIYIFLTVSTILEGIYMLIEVGGEGLLIMLLGPVAIRLIYEFIMMFISLVENVSDINKQMKGQAPQQPQAPTAPFTPPVQEPVNYASFVKPVTPVTPVEQAPQQPQAVFCTNCGAKCEADSRFCISCGTPIN